MANVSFTISPAPGVTNDLIAVIYKTTAPAAEVDRIVKPDPHPDPYNFQFSDLVPGEYFVKIHESPDGSTLGNLRHDFWVDAVINKLTAYEVKTFQVGQGRGAPYYDPANGTDDYINPDLNGLDYTVFKPGYGPLDWDANINPYTGGGFSFIDGQIFSQDEIYTILVNNLVQSAVPQTGVGFPEDILEITGDTTFTSTHHNKELEINGSATIVTITIPDLNTIPDLTQWAINTHNGTQRYVTLQLPVGKYCLVDGVQRNAVYIAKGENAKFIKKGNYLRVKWEGDHRRVGERVYGDGKAPINSLPLTGGWKSKADYPRIFYWHINELPVGELGVGTDDVTPDATNRVKWIIGATKFWVSDHGGYFYRPIDTDQNIDPNGNRLANIIQAGDNKSHNHVNANWDKAGSKALDTGSDGTPGSVDSANAATEYRVAGMTSGMWTDATIFAQGSEARPINLAANVYVII
jgi:hypothetical protein